MMVAALSNRSMALSKCARFEEALADANRILDRKPKWCKAHYRKATALGGLSRWTEAAKTFANSASLARMDNDEASAAQAEKALWDAVKHCTREQLAQLILERVEDACVPQPTREDVSLEEQEEALFQHIFEAHRDKPFPGVYYKRTLSYLKRPMTVGEALIERSAMYTKAKAYGQAADDARNAVAFFERARKNMNKSGESERAARLAVPTAEAYCRLAEAHIAEVDHPLRRWDEAAKAYTKAVDLDPSNGAYQTGLREAGEQLSSEAMQQVLREVYRNEHATDPLIEGLTTDTQDRGHAVVLRVDGTVRFTNVPVKKFSAAARDALRTALAAAAGVNKLRATIERVRPPSPATQRKLCVSFAVVVADAAAAAGRVRDALHADVAAALGGDIMLRCLGCSAGDVELAEAEVVDVTPKHGVSDEDLAAMRGAADGGADHYGGDDEQEEQFPGLGHGIGGGYNATAHAYQRQIVPSRPQTDIEMPYLMYKLVRVDGRAIERVDKHPFQMTRVHYNDKEKPEEVFVEISDGSCRWTQTGSEVRVLCLHVPTNLSVSDLDVLIEARRITICHAGNGTVYLDGDLERGVVPDESTWTYDEDGLWLYLRKMNLELLRKSNEHGEMWWPKLFVHHGGIAWDDFDKDYSDLPHEILARHRRIEAEREHQSQLDQAERNVREALTERDECRKRARQERLHELRTGSRKSWVYLNRENPNESEIGRYREEEAKRKSNQALIAT